METYECDPFDNVVNLRSKGIKSTETTDDDIEQRAEQYRISKYERSCLSSNDQPMLSLDSSTTEGMLCIDSTLRRSKLSLTLQ